MKMRSLTTAILCGLSLTSLVALAGPADQHGTLALQQLHTLMDSPASRSSTADTGEVLLWFTDVALQRVTPRASALAAYRRGVPVAVLRGPADPQTDTVLHGLFGVASAAQLAVYRRGPDGTVHVHSVAELPTSAQARLQVADQLRHGLTRPLPALPTAALPDNADEDAQLIALPRLVYTDTEYASSGNGASATVRAELVRDSGRAYDVLTLSASSQHNLKPHHNGLSGRSIIVPGRYRYFMRLHTPDNTGTQPTLMGAQPLSSPSTDLRIDESHTTTTRYGFGLSREVSAGLQGKVPTAAAKASFSFDFSREYSTTNALSFTVKDYSIAASADQPAAQASRTYWDLPLAPYIASKADYFGSRPGPGRMTPSMRQVTAQGSAAWFMPGTYAGTLNLLAGATIDNLEFKGNAIDAVPDPLPQPTAGVSIDTRSPYLTREVTVFIQSKAGNGGCLRDRNGVVVIAPCPDTGQGNWMEDLHAQWQLDSHGRYYNRGSKNCMQILTQGLDPTGDGEIVTRRCTTQRDQRWEWQADRIHTLHGDGHPDWRMFVGPGNIVGVRTTGLPEYQPIPANPYHPLLNPWSSYPRAPGSADFIPRLGELGDNPPVSEEIKKLSASPARERWELVVLRQSLHR